ncbi:MAG: metallophosphoesterase family protein [Solirubrobacteraceae bacterium]
MGHLLGTFDLSARRLRTWSIALLLGAGLSFVASSQAKTKHQPVKKCRAGYVRRTVHVPKRKHGRIVRVRGKIVYIRVRRCVKVKPHPPKCRAGYVLRSVRVPVRRHGRIVRKHGKIVYKHVWQCVKVKPKPPPPPPPPPPPVTVVAVGDIACPAGDTTNPCKQQQTATLAANQDPADVLVLGDTQYDHGAFSEYQGVGAYNATWGVLNPFVHPVPGNHEYDTSGASGYFQYFGAVANPPDGYYSFNIGTWHIVALNSDCSDSGCQDSLAGATSSRQVSWLQSDLAAHPAACTLAYWHHPLFSSGFMSDSPGVGPLWTALYSAHADVVLNGHDHLYERYAQQDPSGAAAANGIREFVVGTGGENLDPISTLEANLQSYDASDFGVLVLTLHAGSYDWAFKNTSGAVIDSGSTACHGSGSGAVGYAAAGDVGAPRAPRLAGPTLLFDARPLRSSLTAVARRGLPVAVHCSRGCDVSVTASLRRGNRLQRIGVFRETESEIPKPYSQILLRLPARRLQGLRHATLVLRFAAIDAAEHHRVVTRIVALKR